MPGIDAALAVWIMGLTHSLGLVGAITTRRCAGSRLESVCQRVYFGLLALAGAVTMISLYVGPLAWILSATTLSIMVLLATYDCGPERDLATAHRTS